MSEENVCYKMSALSAPIEVTAPCRIDDDCTDSSDDTPDAAGELGGAPSAIFRISPLVMSNILSKGLSYVLFIASVVRF